MRVKHILPVFILIIFCCETATATRGNIERPHSLSNQLNALTIAGTTSNPTCAGGGAITLSVSGGTMPYKYLWSNGATTASITDLPAGVYSVRVTDANENRADAKFSLEPQQIEIVATKTDSDCTASNVSVSLQVSGGQHPYSFEWSHGPLSKDVTGLTPGQYSVLVKDAAGCSKTHVVTVHEPATYTATFSVVPATNCNPAFPSGHITVHIEGGNAPFLYFWEAGVTNVNRSRGLPAGMHTVEIVDANGCRSAPYEVEVPFQPIYPVVSLQSIPNGNCGTNATGSIHASIAAEGSYAYSLLKDGQQIVTNTSGVTTSSLSFSGLAEGPYELEVSSVQTGCSVRSGVVVGQALPLLQISAVAVTEQTDCGFGNGTAQVMAVTQNGVNSNLSDYSFQWTDSYGNVVAAHSAAITDLVAGTYFVTATRLSNPGSGCSSDPFVVIVPYMPQTTALEISVQPDRACSGTPSGAIITNIISSIPASEWRWIKLGDATFSRSGSEATSVSITGLAAGEYRLFVTAVNGCEVSAEVVVPQERITPIINYTKGDVSCNGAADGWISVEEQEGVEYTWWKEGEPLATAPQAHIEGLQAGTYELKAVNNQTACEESRYVVINEPSALQLSSTVRQLSAHGAADGEIQLTVEGGTPPYTFLWNNGSTNSVLTGLAPATYIATVTDAQNCTFEESFIIEEKEPLGIADGAETGMFSISKVPNGNLQVQIANDVHAESISIYRLNGQAVAKVAIMGNRAIEFSLPASGPTFYVLLLTTKDTLYRKKFLF